MSSSTETDLVEQNVIPLPGPSPLLETRVTAFHQPSDRNHGPLFFETDWSCAKDMVSDIMRAHPNSSCKTLITLKSGRAIECLEAYEIVVKKFKR